MHIIEIKNVSKQFGELLAVSDVSLTLEEGEFTTLLGPSGCGKTTTLRLLAGIQKPDSGEIWQNGRIVASRQQFVAPENRRVGLVFQDYALFPHLSVQGNIAFGIKRMQRNDRDKRVDQMLALVGLTGAEDKMPHTLSGGQQQRVALARALAPAPNIMLLDEPFSNLDTALRAQVRAEVRSILRTAGTTTIFVTHDQEEALSLSDKVAVMFEGKVQQVGTPDELYLHPVSKQVAAFIGEANFVDAEANGMRADSVLGQVPLLRAAQGNVSLMIRPEALRLSQNGATGVAAMVRWREYYGHDQRVGITLEDGTELIARTEARQHVTRGQQVNVTVSDEVLAF